MIYDYYLYVLSIWSLWCITNTVEQKFWFTMKKINYKKIEKKIRPLQNSWDEDSKYCVGFESNSKYCVGFESNSKYYVGFESNC